MRLKITDRRSNYGSDTYVLSHFEFGCKEYHPFIATTEWEAVELDVTSNTPGGVIRQLVGITKVIPFIDMAEDITPRMVSVLFEIFPDERGRLRTAMMAGQGKLKETIKELSEQYQFKEALYDGWQSSM